MLSPFVARAIAHLASEKMFRTLYSNMTISFVNLHSMLEAFVDLLREAHLLFWNQFVW